MDYIQAYYSKEAFDSMPLPSYCLVPIEMFK